MGLTFAFAVRLFARQSLVEQGMPFVVTKKPIKAAGMLSKYLNKKPKNLYILLNKKPKNLYILLDKKL